MEGEQGQLNNDNNEFRFSNLVFAEEPNQTTYTFYQRQLVNNKTLNTRFHNESKKELGKTLKKPKNDALLNIISIEKTYYIGQSLEKVNKLVDHNKEMTALVNGVNFEDHQLQAFEIHIDNENRDALKKHLQFVEDLGVMTQVFNLRIISCYHHFVIAD